MYLKQIELENFKSFGGKLTVPLMEGYLAVTGPNGSGKSNITDAILFVLGPKSSKAVRAGKLTDLIFDGGKAKGKAGYTKVSLVFDNADRLMPWDDDAVRLTRYVKLSDNGTDYSSYFYINDRKSSLTEFDSLLTKARISADGYNMVQQGDVTRIVQMGNLERRRLLDAISGIASYDDDISKARGEKLEAEANLTSINIRIEEIAAQLEKLEKDREDARKYVEAQRLLETAKAQLTFRELQIEEAKLQGLSEYVSRLSEEVAALREKKAQLLDAHAANEQAVLDKEREIGDKAGPEYRRVKGDISNKVVEIATQKDRMSRIADDREEHEAYITQVSEDCESIRTERSTVTANLTDTAIKLDAAEKDLQAAKDEDAKINDSMSKQGGEHAQLQKRIEKLDEDLDAKEKEEHEAGVNAARMTAAADEMLRAKTSLEERLQAAEFEIKDAEWNLQQVKQQAGPAGGEDNGKKIVDAKRKEVEYERQEEELKNAIRRLETQYNDLMTEKKVSDRTSGKSSAVTAILGLRDTGQASGIRGTIQELATVKQGYETAIAVAAGGRAQAVIVDDDQVASDCISYLKKEKLGRVTFLPLVKMRGGKPDARAIMTEKQTDGYATSLMSYDQKYANAFWDVFRDTLVVSNISEARSLMGGVRLVTRAGEIFEKGGAIIGGTLNTDNIAKFGAGSESKLNETASKLKAANTSLDILRVQMRQQRDSIRAMDDEMRKAAGEGMGIHAKIGELTAKVTELKRTRQAITDDLRSRSDELSKAQKELSEANRSTATLSAEVEGLRTQRTEVRERIAQIAPVDVQERLNAVRAKVYDLTNLASDLRTQKNTLENESSGLARQIQSAEEQISQYKKKVADGEAESKGYAENIIVLETEMVALRKIERDIESGVEDLKNQKDALVETRYRLETERSSAQEKIESKEGIKAQQEAMSISTAQRVDQLKAEAAEIKIEVPQPIPSEEEIKRVVRSHEGTLSRIGNVNLRAIEEYDERKARYDSLMADVDRLNKQINDLNALTESLNHQKKGLFMESYNAVNVNFKEVYAQLSGGGEAFMGLEDEGDPFVGGLTINAKPKNGKLLRLEALSGGEKSLTALAFIFAIQEYQPSPFYVLDEVDMFLDSVNAEMVARRVKESSAKAQFIQVSLRKVTLAMADHLIGVTRPPTGISKVIIQPDLAEVSKYEEEALKQQPQT
ncbi:MAG: chromosome segregation protein SMC [Candidatus Methanoplasma sp.]|nr:chromosome segregation protein SMC [Candidatus Methanoplasma sp.]